MLVNSMNIKVLDVIHVIHHAIHVQDQLILIVSLVVRGIIGMELNVQHVIMVVIFVLVHNVQAALIVVTLCILIIHA